MHATLSWAAALTVTILAAANASAFDNQRWYPNYPYQGFRTYNGPFPYPGYRIVPGPILSAPDMMGPGFYTLCPNQVWYGPNYCVTPPFPPFQGVLPGKQGQQIQATLPSAFSPTYAGYFRNYGGYPGQPAQTQSAFPTHPYARSPRDFFMWRENQEEQNSRASRPSLVP